MVILTRRFALELGQYGITVNAVAPGFVRTDMTHANAVVFLASPESGWITAQVLTVDGGRMDYIGHG